MLDPMDCLRDGVPLSLVIDLLAEDGPNATRIYADEAADTEWALPMEEWRLHHAPYASAS